MSRRLWRIALWLLFAMLLGAALLPVTERGTQLLFRAAERFSPLQLQHRSGALLGQLQISRLAWPGPGVELELLDIEAELAPACLWRSVICFRRLQAGLLDLGLLPESGDEAPVTVEPGVDQALLEFPVQVEIDSLLVQSGLIRWENGLWRQGRLQARVTLAGSAVKISDAVVTEPRLELIDPAPEQSPEREPIELPRIDLPLQLLVDDLLLEEASWSFDGTEGQLESLLVRGGWRNTALGLETLQLRSGQWGELFLQGSLDFAQSWPLDLQARLMPAGLSQWPEQLEKNISVSASGDLAALTIKAQAGGDAAVSAEAELNALDPALPFALVLRGEWPQTLALAQFAELPEPLADLSLASPLLLTASGDLDTQLFQLRGSAAGGGYTTLGLDLAGRHHEGVLSIEDMSLQDAGGSNSLWAAGEVSVGERLQWRLELASSGFDLPALGDPVSGRLQGKLRLTGFAAKEQWRVALGDIDINGTVNSLPALVTGFVGINQDLRLARSELNAELNGARLSLSAPGETGDPGKLELTVEDLGLWQPESRGRLNLQASLAADWTRLDVTGSLAKLEWAGLAIDEGSILGSYQPRSGHAFSVDLLLSKLGIQAIEMDSVRLSATGNELNQTLSLRSQGELGFDLNLSGAIRDQRDWVGELAPTAVQTTHGSWQLAEPVALAWSGAIARLQVAPHCWQSRQTKICPGELLLAEQGSGSVAVDGGMEFLEILLPMGIDVQGEMHSGLNAAWGPDTGLLVDGDLQTRDVLITRYFGVGESATVNWEKAEAVVRNDRQGMLLTARMDRNGGRKLELDVLLPADREEALTGGLTFEGLQLSIMAPLAPELSSLEGGLNGRLQLGGTADAPQLFGKLMLAGGGLTLVGNPTELTDLDLVIEALGDRAEILGGGVLGGGRVELSGHLETAPQWRLELAASGDKQQILAPPATELLISEQLELVIAAGQLDVSGRIVLHEGVLKHEELPAGSVGLSGDVVKVDYAGNVIEDQRPFDTRINIILLIEDKLNVVGDLVNATLGGDLQLLQEPGQPLQLFGNLVIVGGELHAYQQRLRIERGTVSFSGRKDNPELDVRAQREIRTADVIVGVHLQGSLQQPVLEIFSDPLMERGEMLSYLVRGRGMDAGASADGLAMALSMGTGIVNRSVLVEELNRIPGISNVAFGSEGTDEDMSATVGGYVGNRLYLSYGMGIYEPVNVIIARLYLQTRLWLEVVSQLENSVDLYYAFDID